MLAKVKAHISVYSTLTAESVSFVNWPNVQESNSHHAAQEEKSLFQKQIKLTWVVHPEITDTMPE